MSTLVTILSFSAAMLSVYAYPSKDDDSFYYGRLHDLSNFNKETRNLDGIDGRSAVAVKANQDLGADKGSQSHYRLGGLSGSHLDGIGGGHLVRDLELDIEQGLGLPSVAVNPQLYGRTVLFPREGSADENKFQYLAALSKHGLVNAEERSFGGDYDLILNENEGKSLRESKLVEEDLKEEDILESKRKRQMDQIGGGHLLGKKALGEKQVKSNLNMLSNTPKQMDYLEGGHLLAAKREMDSLGGGHLLKRLDSLAGDYLLAAKREMDELGGGHLLKRLDSLGGGHLLAAKRQMDSLGGGHLLAAKRQMDSLGGGHLLAAKRENYDFGEDSLSKRLDALGGGHLLATKRTIGSSDESHLITIRSYGRRPSLVI